MCKYYLTRVDSSRDSESGTTTTENRVFFSVERRREGWRVYGGRVLLLLLLVFFRCHIMTRARALVRCSPLVVFTCVDYLSIESDLIVDTRSRSTRSREICVICICICSPHIHIYIVPSRNRQSSSSSSSYIAIVIYQTSKQLVIVAHDRNLYSNKVLETTT